MNMGGSGWFPLLLAGCAVAECRAQNLLPNASFEEYEIECIGGVGYPSVLDWSTPECANGFMYFNECNNTIAPDGGVPQNSLGHAMPNTGAAYCGIVTFTYPENGGNVKRYGSTSLSAALVQGETYCLRFYLSLGDSSAYTTSALHAFLWYGLPSTCGYNDTLWDEYAAVTYDLSGVGPDGWTLMEGSFVAEGGEVNLTLGSFLYGADIDTTETGLIQQPTPMAMYYIDDVYLGPCDIGMGEVANDDTMEVYPNPAVDELRVSFRDVRPTEVRVVNAVGAEVLRKPVSSSTMSLDISVLAPGAYQMRVLETGRPLLVRGFVKVAD